ncbi:MAG TPA: LCP family protein [Actinomycetota bacterium]|nr:LCP family protein [Actinomycetota bacterium]
MSRPHRSRWAAAATTLVGAAACYSLDRRRSAEGSRRPAASNPLGRANFATTIPSEARSEPAPGRPGGPRHPRRRPLTLRRLTAALAAGTALIWGAGALVAQVAESQTPSPVTSTTSVQGHAEYPSQNNGVIHFAVMGSDDRSGPPNASGGCDAIHIVSVNTQTMKGSIINVPRDTYLQGHKITDICRAQGFQAGVNALQQYTGIPIQYFAYTNFRNFVQVMDEVGGLPIHVYSRLYNPNDTGANWNAGDYHFTGGELLAFARERDTAPGGDFGRTTDQAQIMLSGFNQFDSTPQYMGFMLELIKYGRQHVQFNIPLTTLIQWGMIARQMTPTDFQSCTLLGNGQMIGGADVEIPAASNQAIFPQVTSSGTLPGNAQCFEAPGVYPNEPAQGIDWEIPAGE